MKTLTCGIGQSGTTTFFAAVELVEENRMVDGLPHHRHQEWIRFLKRIERPLLRTRTCL
jgi:hypothetical protein